MGFEDDLCRAEEHVAEARRLSEMMYLPSTCSTCFSVTCACFIGLFALVHRQKGLIIRLSAAGVSTLDAQRILWLLESNLRRFEEYRDRPKEGPK
jgi:hypothetical protein